jgi:hypothetical protein
MSVHTTHLSGEQIKSAYALIEKVAYSDHPLAAECAAYVAGVEGSQFDRNPQTWTEAQHTDSDSGLTYGTGRFTDSNGNRVPRAAVLAYLATLPSGDDMPDDISELDDLD